MNESSSGEMFCNIMVLSVSSMLLSLIQKCQSSAIAAKVFCSCPDLITDV